MRIINRVNNNWLNKKESIFKDEQVPIWLKNLGESQQIHHSSC